MKTGKKCPITRDIPTEYPILVHDQVYNRIALEDHVTTFLECAKYKDTHSDPVTQKYMHDDGSTAVLDLMPAIKLIKKLKNDYESREIKRQAWESA